MQTHDRLRPLRERVRRFMTEHVEPAETVLAAGGPAAAETLARLREHARREELWALGHPAEIGGGGLPFLDYVAINEVQGRSEFGQFALGTWTLQDSLMIHRHASEAVRRRYLTPLVEGRIGPSFAMTEPDAAGSDPTQLRTSARRDGDHWVISGLKWFTTGAADAAFTTVMCRTEPDAPDHHAFSLLVVPTDTPGYTIERETAVLGLRGGHYQVRYDDVRVPAHHLLGEPGQGFAIAQERLGPGRIFHAMRWLGQAQRAFDLMCTRLNERTAFGGPLAEKQAMQRFVFDSYTQIQSARALTLEAARKLDQGDEARIEISAVKVVGAAMVHDVIDRAVQVFGAAGLTDDLPLSHMYRAARFARIYDGPDEVHIQRVGRRILGEYRAGRDWEFGLR